MSDVPDIDPGDTVRNQTFNILKVLERGPLRLVKVTFTRHLGDIYNVKGHLL